MFPLKINHDLQLRLLEPGHAPRLFELVDSNRAYLREWLPFVDDYRSVAAATQFITRSRERSNGRTRLAMGIWSGESLAGVVTYDYIDWGNRAALIGFWLGKSYQGNGIMTRTCSALIDFAFQELGLNRVEIFCTSKNRKCRLVPERLGFKQEGVSRQRSGYATTLSIPSLTVCWLQNGKSDSLALRLLCSSGLVFCREQISSARFCGLVHVVNGWVCQELRSLESAV